MNEVLEREEERRDNRIIVENIIMVLYLWYRNIMKGEIKRNIH
jgi:hypothetical protein